MMISLIHPSRGRPKKSFDTVQKWLDKFNGFSLEIILSGDYSDPCWKEYHEIYEPINVIRIVGNNTSVVDATNRAAKFSKGGILIYLSDDFEPCENWGPLVMKEFEGVEGPLLLKVHDNLQAMSARVLTIPIMNRALYDKLNYFWHPEYKSMWVDCDLYETCARLGVIKNAPHLVFPHQHHSIGKAENDETYRRSEANWNQGLEVFNRRKRLNFPV